MSTGNIESILFPKEFLNLNAAKYSQISCGDQLYPVSLGMQYLYIFYNLNSNCDLNVLQCKCRKQCHRESEESGKATAVNRKITEADTKNQYTKCNRRGPAMKKLHIKSLTLLMIFFIAFYPAAAPQGNLFTAQAEAASIRLSTSSAVVPIGIYKRLAVRGTSKRGCWSLSNKAVATISSSGVIIGRKAGKTTVTAKVAGRKLRCSVLIIDRRNSRHVTNAVLKFVRKYYRNASVFNNDDKEGSFVYAWVNRKVDGDYPFARYKVNINTEKAVIDDDLPFTQYFRKVPRTFYVWNCKKARTRK